MVTVRCVLSSRLAASREHTNQFIVELSELTHICCVDRVEAFHAAHSKQYDEPFACATALISRNSDLSFARLVLLRR